MTILCLCAAWFVSACTLVNQTQPNEAPALEASGIDTLQLRRGATVRLRITASDEDYDPLFFAWQAYRLDEQVLGAILALSPNGHLSQPDELRSLFGLVEIGEAVGGFMDSTAQTDGRWTAPLQIEGEAERFLLTVAVRDRECRTIDDPMERSDCTAGESQFVQLYAVTVTQRPPQLQAPPDTSVAFSEPSISLEARFSDPDGDGLRVDWVQTAGPELPFSVEPVAGGSRLHAVPLSTGDYAFSVQVSDGVDSLSAETRLSVTAQPLPAGQMVSLELPGGTPYEIDRYEYPGEPGTFPELTDTWFAAIRLCAAQGKRLCTKDEWINACEGASGMTFSSTDAPPDDGGTGFGYRFCNTSGSEASSTSSPAASGSFPNCRSDYGVYDLTGNLREWVGQVDDAGRMTGGISESDATDTPPSPCDTFSEFAPLPDGLDYLHPDVLSLLPPEYSEGYLQFGVGLRCCR
jgi:hypothetical protein